MGRGANTKLPSTTVNLHHVPRGVPARLEPRLRTGPVKRQRVNVRVAVWVAPPARVFLSTDVTVVVCVSSGICMYVCMYVVVAKSIETTLD